ncbi:hypothetical protein SLA2020_050340 [Shorea laevis]
MSFNGVAHIDVVDIGVIFVTSNDKILPYAFMLTQHFSNNMTEYQALIIWLEMAIVIRITCLKVFGDSKLIINQLLSLYEVKKPELVPYINYATKLLNQFDQFTIKHVPRLENKLANALANLA